MNEAQVAKRKRKQAKKDEKKRLKLQQGVGGSEQSFSKKSRLSLAPLQCSSSSAPSSSWNFAVDYNDHFETPLNAYQDILPVLQCIADKKGKLIQDLILYDPYYCKGRMVEYLQSLGIRKVINENKDFYQQVRANQVPEHDVLITNPPYSGEHKPKLLQYLLERKTRPPQQVPSPFLLLLPTYTATKSYWRDFVVEMQTRTAAAYRIQYYMPKDSYNYIHPEGTGKVLPPFYSCWFIGTEHDIDIATSYNEVGRGDDNDCKSKSNGSGKVVNSLETMASLGYVSLLKRGNPKQRNKRKRKTKTTRVT